MKQLLQGLWKSCKLATVGMGFILSLFFDFCGVVYMFQGDITAALAFLVTGTVSFLMSKDLIKTYANEQRKDEDETGD